MAQTPATGTEVGHEDAHAGGVFPPFDPATFSSQLIWLALVFGTLYLLMSRIALPRVAGILEARKAAHEGDLAEAARLKTETEAAIAAFDKALATAHKHAEEIGASTRDRLTAEIMEKRKVFDAEIAANLVAEERVIAASKASALQNVAEIATDTVSVIVAQLTGKAPASAEIDAAVATSMTS